MNSEAKEEPEISAASKRAAGIAALRKIRRLVDEEKANDHFKEIWAGRVAALALVLISLTLLSFLLWKKL